MDSLDTEAKQYENMINGTQIIESNLHKHLAEHLNSEIVRKTIDSIEIAIEWLRSTYFYIRASKNPRYYQICAEPIKEKDKVIHMIQQMCKRELNALNTHHMIIMDSDCVSIMPTPLGNIMAKNCVSLNTMKKFLEIAKRKMTLKELIENISVCEEISQDVMNRVNERKALNTLNYNPENKCSIRFPIVGKVKSVESKVNCLIQATFESLPISEQSLTQDSTKIMRSGQRISKCLADTLILQLNNYKTLLNSIILMKCFKARLWHDSPFVSKQLKGIGINLSSILADKGLTTFEKLRETHPREIEMVLNRHPPYGNQLLEEVSLLPRYSLNLEQNIENGLNANRASFKVTVKMLNWDKLRIKSCKSFPNNHSCYLVVGNDENKVFCFQKIADTVLMRNDGIWIRNNVDIEKGNSKYVYANYISESFCGVDQLLKIKPKFVKQEISSSPESDCDESYSFTEMCQHKCLIKSECRHSCCKKGLANKRKTISIENRKLKRTKIDSQQRERKLKDGSLDKWLNKKPADNNINYPLKTNEKSEYFVKNGTNNISEPKLCEMKTNPIDVNENYDEYDKLLDEPFEYQFDIEDFQNFENKPNNNPHSSNSSYFDLRQWSSFVCHPLPENPNFFIPQ